MHDAQLRVLIRRLVQYSLVSGLAAAACATTDETGDSTDDVNAGGDAGSAGTATGGSGGAAGGTGGLAGGGSGGGDGGAGIEPFWPDLPLNAFDEPPCANGNWQATAGLNPAAPVDFVSLRVKSQFDTSDAGTGYDTFHETGTACSTATDAPACQSALTATGAGIDLTQACGGPPYACQHYLVTTSADDVARYITDTELVGFLGDIDTPNEALLLAFDGTFGGYWVSCGDATRSSVRAVDDGYEVVVTQMVQDCAPIVTERVLLHVSTDGAVTELRRNIASVSSACVGRRTEALASTAECVGRDVGDFFANIAHLEAASVHAFEQLRAELVALDAPGELVAQAKAAALDEIRHAQVTAALAKRYGGRTTEPRVHPAALRDLETVALENAVEGCVRETFGALIAEYQARTAEDAAVAEVMGAIAEDEARHAALAWRVAKWVEPQLDDSAQARVAAARRRAIEELRAELEAVPSEELRRVTGVPQPAVAIELLGGLEHALWA